MNDRISGLGPKGVCCMLARQVSPADGTFQTASPFIDWNTGMNGLASLMEQMFHVKQGTLHFQNNFVWTEEGTHALHGIPLRGSAGIFIIQLQIKAHSFLTRTGYKRTVLPFQFEQVTHDHDIDSFPSWAALMQTDPFPNDVDRTALLRMFKAIAEYGRRVRLRRQAQGGALVHTAECPPPSRPRRRSRKTGTRSAK